MRASESVAGCVFEAAETSFPERVLRSSARTPVLVDFWAEWCHPCLVLGPVLEQVVEAARGALLLAKVEVDDNMRLAGHYRVRGFPTVILFWEGEERGRFSGARPFHHVADFVRSHLPFELVLHGHPHAWTRHGPHPRPAH